MPINHKIRIDGDGGTRTRSLTPRTAVMAHCRECYGFCENVYQEIKACPSELCALWPFRLGHGHSGKILSSDHIRVMQRGRTLQNGREGI